MFQTALLFSLAFACILAFFAVVFYEMSADK